MAMKRLIVCCDGTWNDADQGTDYTNVSRLAWAIKPVDKNGSRRSCTINPASVAKAAKSPKS